MAFWTYMLRCADGRYYSGHTDNLDHRIGQHQAGTCRSYTSTRRPVTLVWSETFASRLEALEAERIVGGWSKAKKEALIRGDWQTVSLFARPKERFSTSLETNGGAGAPSRHGMPATQPFASNEVQPFVSTEAPPFVSSEVEKPSSTP